jgi:hypothetical protein
MNPPHITTRVGPVLGAAILLCMVALTSTPKTADAAQRTACDMLPAASVQAILGSPVMTPGKGKTPTVTNGVTSYQCFYVGKHGASLFIFYNATAAQAAAQASMGASPLERFQKARHGSSLKGAKGNIAFMVSVREEADAGKLKPLLDAAMRNS